ncbi:hypothetical protein GCM10027600_10760 [Nocardioides ginsengisegetis]
MWVVAAAGAWCDGGAAPETAGIVASSSAAAAYFVIIGVLDSGEAGGWGALPTSYAARPVNAISQSGDGP